MVRYRTNFKPQFLAAALITTAACLLLATPASAALICVDDDPCVNDRGGFPYPDLQTAINQADTAGFPGRDTIEVGSGTQFGTFSSDALNPVDIVGNGAGTTVITRTPAVVTAGATILHLADPTATVSDLTVQLNASSGGSQFGLQIAGNARRIVVSDPSGAPNHTGVALTGPDTTLRDSTVSVPSVTGTIALATSGATLLDPATVEDVSLTGSSGINGSGVLVANRVRIAARTQGIYMIGGFALDQASVRLSESGTAFAAAVDPMSLFGGAFALTHVSAVGPGSGAGVSVVAYCDPGGIPAPGNASVRNSILRGFATDLARSGLASCGPPASPPVPANIDIAYSIYDPAKTTPAGSTPGAITTGPGNINADPLFADASLGDLHLLPGSPAIDAGDPAPVGAGEASTDLQGNPRVGDGNNDGAAVRDIGAHEFIFTAPPIDPPADPPVDPPAGVELDRKLNLRYVAKAEEFRGKLRSSEATCVAGRVKVFRVEKGKDPRVGSGKPNTKGRYEVGEPEADGRYYAKAGARLVDAGTCPAVKSRPVDVG